MYKPETKPQHVTDPATLKKELSSGKSPQVILFGDGTPGTFMYYEQNNYTEHAKAGIAVNKRIFIKDYPEVVFVFGDNFDSNDRYRSACARVHNYEQAKSNLTFASAFKHVQGGSGQAETMLPLNETKTSYYPNNPANIVGVPTCMESVARDVTEYSSDRIKMAIANAFDELEEHVKNGRTVVIPATDSGLPALGTGLAGDRMGADKEGIKQLIEFRINKLQQLATEIQAKKDGSEYKPDVNFLKVNSNYFMAKRQVEEKHSSISSTKEPIILTTEKQAYGSFTPQTKSEPKSESNTKQSAVRLVQTQPIHKKVRRGRPPVLQSEQNIDKEGQSIYQSLSSLREQEKDISRRLGEIESNLEKLDHATIFEKSKLSESMASLLTHPSPSQPSENNTLGQIYAIFTQQQELEKSYTEKKQLLQQQRTSLKQEAQQVDESIQITMKELEAHNQRISTLHNELQKVTALPLHVQKARDFVKSDTETPPSELSFKPHYSSDSGQVVIRLNKKNQPSTAKANERLKVKQDRHVSPISILRHTVTDHVELGMDSEAAARNILGAMDVLALPYRQIATKQQLDPEKIDQVINSVWERIARREQSDKHQDESAIGTKEKAELTMDEDDLSAIDKEILSVRRSYTEKSIALKNMPAEIARQKLMIQNERSHNYFNDVLTFAAQKYPDHHKAYIAYINWRNDNPSAPRTGYDITNEQNFNSFCKLYDQLPEAIEKFNANEQLLLELNQPLEAIQVEIQALENKHAELQIQKENMPHTKARLEQKVKRFKAAEQIVINIDQQIADITKLYWEKNAALKNMSAETEKQKVEIQNQQTQKYANEVITYASQKYPDHYKTYMAYVNLRLANPQAPINEYDFQRTQLFQAFSSQYMQLPETIEKANANQQQLHELNRPLETIQAEIKALENRQAELQVQREGAAVQMVEAKNEVKQIITANPMAHDDSTAKKQAYFDYYGGVMQVPDIAEYPGLSATYRQQAWAEVSTLGAQFFNMAQLHLAKMRDTKIQGKTIKIFNPTAKTKRIDTASVSDLEDVTGIEIEDSTTESSDSEKDSKAKGSKAKGKQVPVEVDNEGAAVNDAVGVLALNEWRLTNFDVPAEGIESSKATSAQLINTGQVPNLSKLAEKLDAKKPASKKIEQYKQLQIGQYLLTNTQLDEVNNHIFNVFDYRPIPKNTLFTDFTKIRADMEYKSRFSTESPDRLYTLAADHLALIFVLCPNLQDRHQQSIMKAFCDNLAAAYDAEGYAIRPELTGIWKELIVDGHINGDILYQKVFERIDMRYPPLDIVENNKTEEMNLKEMHQHVTETYIRLQGQLDSYKRLASGESLSDSESENEIDLDTTQQKTTESSPISIDQEEADVHKGQQVNQAIEAQTDINTPSLTDPENVTMSTSEGKAALSLQRDTALQPETEDQIEEYPAEYNSDEEFIPSSQSDYDSQEEYPIISFPDVSIPPEDLEQLDMHFASQKEAYEASQRKFQEAATLDGKSAALCELVIIVERLREPMQNLIDKASPSIREESYSTDLSDLELFTDSKPRTFISSFSTEKVQKIYDYALHRYEEQIQKYEEQLQQAILLSLLEGPDKKEQLQKQAQQWGFNCKDVSGDGRCLFHAIADQLQQHGENYTWDQLLEMTIGHMLANEELYSAFVTRDYNNFIDGLLSGREWAENTVVTALSRILNVNIVVVPSDGGQLNVMKRANAERTLYLGYEVDVHYQSLHYQNDVDLTLVKASMQAIIQSAESDNTPFVKVTPATLNSSSTKQRKEQNDDHAAEKNKDYTRKDEDPDDESFGGSPYQSSTGLTLVKRDDDNNKKRKYESNTQSTTEGGTTDKENTVTLDITTTLSPQNEATGPVELLHQLNVHPTVQPMPQLDVVHMQDESAHILSTNPTDSLSSSVQINEKKPEGVLKRQKTLETSSPHNPSQPNTKEETYRAIIARREEARNHDAANKDLTHNINKTDI